MTERTKELLSLAITMVGANELAKLSATLGDKVFYRLLRDQAKKEYLALGGVIEQETQPGETIVLESNPGFTFYESDIEAMRKLVADFDAKKKP